MLTPDPPTRKVYDSRPEREALLARCQRDRVDPSTLVELVVPQRHYALRVYGRPTTMPVYDWNPATGVVEQLNVPAWLTYSTRRDGRVSNNWGHPVKDADVLEYGSRFVQP